MSDPSTPSPTPPPTSAAKSKPKNGLFWLSEVFPRPEDVFAFKILPAKTLASDGVFALDANALLAPYRVGTESIKDIEAIYSGLAEHSRLFAPAQAVREYGKNRAKKVAEVYGQVHQRISTLPVPAALASPMLEGIKEYEELKKLSEELKAKVKEYKEKLASLKTTLMDWGWEDRVSELYRTVFTSDRIIDHGRSEEDIKEDLTRRWAHKIPPGYKDGGKPDEGVGDLIIWHSLIKLSKDTGKHVVFVSNEEKADWFVRENKEQLFPRPELTFEFYRATGKHLAIIDWARFLELLDAKPETVREAELAKEDRTRLFASLERRVTEMLDVIDGILEEYRAEWVGEPEEPSYRGPPYIADDRLESFIGYFQAAVADYSKLIAKPVGLALLKELSGILDQVLSLNKTLHYIEVRGKHSGDEETRELLDYCREFSVTHQRYSDWVAAERASASG